MPIFYGDKKIQSLYLGDKKLNAIYLRNKLIYSGFTTYVVNLNSQWIETTEYDFGDDYRIFKSNSNYHKNNSTASMFLENIRNPFTDLVVRYYASSEPNYDKLYIESSTNNGSSWKTNATDNGNNNSSAPATLSNYKTYTYSTTNLETMNKFRFRYAKDNSNHYALDRGFIVLPKRQIREVIG
jgi:hypothetical protein